MTPTRRRFLLGTASAAIGLAIGAAIWWPRGTPGGIPFGRPFNLVDTNGTLVTDRSLTGTPYALYFGFTRCPDVCPTSMFEFSEHLKALGPLAQSFRIYFVTVDPERDTPELLAQYTGSFDPRIVGLTGSPQAIAEAATAFRAVYRKVPTQSGDYTMDHTATVFLMNARGDLAGTIAYQEPADSARRKLAALIEGKAALP